jgi:phosphoserine phosphatase RsbU/P
MSESNAITPEQVRLVRSVSRTLARTTDLDALLLQIAQAARDMLDCERSSIFLHDPKTAEFWTKIALDSKEIRVPEKTGIVGAAFWDNQVLDVPDPYTDQRFNPENDHRTGFKTRNILAAPVSGADAKPLGVIQAINKRDRAFKDEDRSLIELLADQAGVAIQRHRFQVEAIKAAALEKEMDLARRVQEAMIPKNPPKVAGLEVAGWTKPASVTGGDVFDLWQTPDGRLGIFLGDASGHGLAPTLVVSQVRTLVRTLAEMDTDPMRILTRINARMVGDLEAGRFITAFVGFMSPNGEVEYCSAGHGPMIVRDAAGSPLRLLEPTLPPVGVLDEMPEERAEPLQLSRGGALVVLSDGIFEARNAAGEMFGIKLVCEKLNEHRDLSPRQVIEQIYQLVRAWQGQDDPADDQTIVLAAPACGALPPDEA